MSRELGAASRVAESSALRGQLCRLERALVHWARGQSFVRSVSLLGSAADATPHREWGGDVDLLLVRESCAGFMALANSAQELRLMLARSGVGLGAVVLDDGADRPLFAPGSASVPAVHLLLVADDMLGASLEMPDRMTFAWALRHRTIYGPDPFCGVRIDVRAVDHIHGDGGLRQLRAALADTLFADALGAAPNGHRVVRRWVAAMLAVPFPVRLRPNHVRSLTTHLSALRGPAPEVLRAAAKTLWTVADDVERRLRGLPCCSATPARGKAKDG